MKKIPQAKNDKALRPTSSRKYFIMSAACGLVLILGFFCAARQHFAAINYGIKNARLRQQKESLESDQRRFELAREVAVTPNELKKAIKKAGYQSQPATTMGFLPMKSRSDDGMVKTIASVRSTDSQPGAVKADNDKPLVKKTVLTAKQTSGKSVRK
jgi:hypothetical protein